MMFSGTKGASVSNLFKKDWHKELNLTREVRIDVPPEIELSGYQRVLRSGSESPSGLLNGEGFTVEPISDLDLFFGRLYNYYNEKGLWCIVTKWIVELLALGFIICFSGFFLLFIDIWGLLSAKCGIDAVGSGIKPCDLAKEALHRHPLTPFTVSKVIIVGYLAICSIYWIFCFLRFFTQLKDILMIRHFYYNSLQVTDTEIKTTPWESILDKVVQIQRSQHLCVVKDLSTQDVIMRVMRKENYLIGMVNKGVLGFPISKWVPGAGPAIHSVTKENKYHLILTKTLEWALNWCILQSMFDRNFYVHKEFVSNPKALKKRLIAVGFGMLLLSPFLVMFTLAYFFLRFLEPLYNHPSTASSRSCSNLSKWILREFNEVEHLFKHRINNSIVHVADYLKQFPSPIISIIAKFIAFVSGGFVAILIIIAFLEESLLEGHIFGRNLIWYGAVFSAVTAFSRAAVTDDLQVLDPEGAMASIVQHTHYMPKRWRGKEHTDVVRKEFETLYQYTGVMLLEEMASIFCTPYLLLFIVPKRVDDILQFISDFTVDVEGVGHVCSLSLFDFESHGNSKYGSPYNAPRARRSSQGKMEKSFLSFQSSYPTWEPSVEGKKFLSNLASFREQKLNGQRAQQAFAPPRTLTRTPNYRSNSDFHNNFSREILFNNNGSVPLGGHRLGPFWMFDADQRNRPYLLDWYYTSQPLQNGASPRDAPSLIPEMSEEPIRDFVPFDTTAQHRLRFQENWDFSSDRLQSHLDATTSEPFFRGSLLHHHRAGDVEHPSRSEWWARSVQHSEGPQTSFLEPPMFGRHISDNELRSSFFEPSPMSGHHTSDYRPHSSFVAPLPTYGSNISDNEPHSTFLAPPSVSGRQISDNGPRSSFLAPPPISGRQVSDNEPHSSSSDNEPHSSSLEPPPMSGRHISDNEPHSSFLEPPPMSGHHISGNEPHSSSLEPPPMSGRHISGNEPQSSFLKPPPMSGCHISDNEPHSSSLEPPRMSDRHILDNGPHSSFLKPPRMSGRHISDDEPRSSFLEPPPMCGRHISDNEADSSFLEPPPMCGRHISDNEADSSFLEPPMFGRHISGNGPQSSFLDPPIFGRDTSDESKEEEEEYLDWRNSGKLSRTVYMDDSEIDGEFNLPFNEIYSKSNWKY